MVSREGLHSCPVATGVIFAVNVGVRGSPGAALDAYCQGLLVSMQARQPTFEPSKQLEAHTALSNMRAERQTCEQCQVCKLVAAFMGRQHGVCPSEVRMTSKDTAANVSVA